MKKAILALSLLLSMITATTGATYTDCMKYFRDAHEHPEGYKCGLYAYVKYYCGIGRYCIRRDTSCDSSLFIGTSYEQTEYKNYRYDAYLEKDS